MRIWTKIEWLILGAATLLLLLLFVLFAFSHPHSDDFSYQYFLQHKGYWNATKYIFTDSGGRFFSTFLIFLSPLKNHSIEGYQMLTSGLFLFFVASLYAFLYLLLRSSIATKNIVFLFAFCSLALFSFIPNLHQFAYWLCAEATYLIAAALWLWSVVFNVLLAQPKHEKKWWLWLLTILISTALVGCSEVAMLLNIIPLSLHYFYRKQMKTVMPKGFWLLSIIFFIVVFATVFSGGNLNRHHSTPFSGNILLAFSGGFYAAGFWLSKWALIFMPITCFYILVFGHHLRSWAASVARFTFFKAKTIFISSILFFTAAQILVVWMTGSTPELRFENVLFLFLLLAFLFAAQMMRHEQAEFFDMLKGKLHRGFKTLSSIYLLSIFLVMPNHFADAFWDVTTGNAMKFDKENIERYALIAHCPDSICAVPPIMTKPQILYFATLTCDSKIDETDIPRIGLADYFGKKWIYENPCNQTQEEYNIKTILKQKREQFFSK